MEGFGESTGVGDVAGKNLRTFSGESLQMSCVSADDTNLLSRSKKIARHDMSGISACSQYDKHKRTSFPAWMSSFAIGLSKAGDKWGVSLGIDSAQNQNRVMDLDVDEKK